MTKKFNIRVYGILLNDFREVLVTDEHRMGMNMTKFVGGGLEIGEGITDCLKREWREELGVEIEIIAHFYTTDFFVQSAFNDSQLISIYYLIKLNSELKIPITNKPFDFKEVKEEAQSFRWLSIDNLSEKEFTFVIDKKVAEQLRLIK